MRPGRTAAALILIAAAVGALGAVAGAAGGRLPPGHAPPPVPADNPMSVAKIELGRQLFYDADLSIDGTMACATCHEQKRAFTEGNATHPGVHGDPGRRNVMALANVASFTSYTWGDPRLTTLEAQARVPLTGDHPVEMGFTGEALAVRLAAEPCYRTLFAAAFPGDGGAVNLTHISQALAAFERTLVSGDAPVDRFRRGDASALGPAALRGRALFQGANLNCATCHAGIDFTDAAGAGKDPMRGFHRIETPTGPDRGLGEITGRPADDGAFRTPSLRNIGLTAPYLHDGSARTLTDAIRRHSLANPGVAALDPGRMANLLAYLEAMTDRTFVENTRFALPARQCGR